MQSEGGQTVDWLGTGEVIIITAIAIQSLMELYVYQKKNARRCANTKRAVEKTIS